MSEPVCTRCKVTSCLVWQRDKDGAIICLDCQAAEKTAKTPLPWVPPPHVSHSAGKTAKAASKLTQQPVNQVTPAHSQTDQSLPVSGVTTRRTTRSHERAKARQQQQHTASPSPAPAPPTTAAQSSSGGNGSSKVVESPTPPAMVEGILDTPSPVPSGNGQAGTTPATFTSRRSLKQSQSVQAAEHELYTVTSNSMQYQVGQDVYVCVCGGGGGLWAI